MKLNLKILPLETILSLEIKKKKEKRKSKTKQNKTKKNKQKKSKFHERSMIQDSLQNIDLYLNP